MGKQFSRYGWRWSMPIMGLFAWLSLGCNPQSLSMLLMPFSGNLVEPEHKIFTGRDELALVVLVDFADSHQPRTEVEPVKIELADKLEKYIYARCAENKHNVKIVPQVKVASYALRQRAEGESSPVDLGKHFKADYVIALTIRSCEIYAKNTHPPFYRGQANVDVNLYKTKGKHLEAIEFTRNLRAAYPDKNGIPADSMSVAQFRGYFMNYLARDISKMFIAFPQQERHQIDLATGTH